MHIKWPIDTAPRKVNWCQIWPGNTQGSRFSQLAFFMNWMTTCLRSCDMNVIGDAANPWRQSTSHQFSWFSYTNIYGPWSDKTGLNDITTLHHNIGFYTDVTNTRRYAGNNTIVYFRLFFKCSVLDFLCNLRFNYKNPWLNSDSILKFESDLRVKTTCLNLSGQSRWIHTVGCVSA